MGKNKYHPYITSVHWRCKTQRLSVLKKSSRYKLKQDRQHFQLFQSCISNFKSVSSIQNESIDKEHLVSAHVIPVKIDMEQGSINSSLRTPPLSPIPHSSKQNVSYHISQLASPCVRLVKINLEWNSENYTDTSTVMEEKIEANANFPDWISVLNVTSAISLKSIFYNSTIPYCQIYYAEYIPHAVVPSPDKEHEMIRKALDSVSSKAILWNVLSNNKHAGFLNDFVNMILKLGIDTFSAKEISFQILMGRIRLSWCKTTSAIHYEQDTKQL